MQCCGCTTGSDRNLRLEIALVNQPDENTEKLKPRTTSRTSRTTSRTSRSTSRTSFRVVLMGFRGQDDFKKGLRRPP